MLERLNSWDTSLFLLLNGHHDAFFDPIMYWISNKLFWAPFYLFIIVLVILAYKKRSLLIFLCVGALIALSDQLASHLIKNVVRRLRPSHAPALAGLVHLSKAGPGGMYGFVSSHAANSFALFVFLSLILDNRFKWLKYILGIWAVLICYSRVYVGVHYPGDILGGALLGTGIGYVVSLFYKWAAPAFFPQPAAGGRTSAATRRKIYRRKDFRE
jgi:undecaprenyl-diphosphatase